MRVVDAMVVVVMGGRAPAAHEVDQHARRRRTATRTPLARPSQARIVSPARPATGREQQAEHQHAAGVRERDGGADGERVRGRPWRPAR